MPKPQQQTTDAPYARGASVEDVIGGGEIATQGNRAPATLGPWAEWLLGRGELPVVDPSIISEKIAMAMLTAETPEDLFAAGNALSFDDLIDVPIMATTVYPMRSRFKNDGGSDVFMVIDAVRLDTGENVVVTTSGQNIMRALCRAQDAGWVEFKFRVQRLDHETTDGYKPFIVLPV